MSKKTAIKNVSESNIILTNEIILGQRYEFPLTIPPDGRYESGLVDRIKDDVVFLKTKEGVEWMIPIENLRKVRKIKRL